MDFKATQPNYPQAYLYQLVYGVSGLKYVILMMVGFFLLHPVVPAFASELKTDDSNANVNSADSVESAAEPETETETETEPVSELEGSVANEPSRTETESLAGDEPFDSTDPDPAIEATTAVIESTSTETEDRTIGADVSTDSETGASSRGDQEINNESVVVVNEELYANEQSTTTSTEAQLQGNELAIAADGTSALTNTDTTTSSALLPDSATATSSASTTASTLEPFITSTNAASDTPAATSEETDELEFNGDVSVSDKPTVVADEPLLPSLDGELDSASADDDVNEGLVAGDATTTTKAVTPEEPAISASQPMTRGEYEFSAAECREVEDGAYYCTRTVAEIIDFDTDETTVVLAAPDADGDNEIYFNDRGTLRPLTNNQYDDAAPYYDSESHSVVWHGLIDDRYQIFMYDLATEQALQLTEGRSNSMEPSRHGNYIVWQQWVENNWEIVLWNDGVITQVTSNVTHDILPDVQDGYVIWSHGHSQSESEVMVYEIESGTRAAITDAEGGQVVNPRFVLVYDTKFANGDSITKGFDPRTGELIPLAAQPGDLPPEIPDADSTGETRALIQNKNPNSREDDDLDATPTPLPLTGSNTATTSATSTVSATASDSVTEAPNGSGQATSSATASDPVNVVTNEPVSAIDMASTSDETLPLTDFDLIVEPASSTLSQSVSANEGVSTTTD